MTSPPSTDPRYASESYIDAVVRASAWPSLRVRLVHRQTVSALTALPRFPLMVSALTIAWSRASRDPTVRRLGWTTSESADRSSANAYSALAKQASDDADPVRSVLVRSDSAVTTGGVSLLL